MAEKDDSKKAEGKGDKPKKDKPAKSDAAAPKGDKKAKDGGKGGKGRKDEPQQAAVSEKDSGPVRSGPPRLKVLYEKEIAPRLQKEFKFKSAMQIPRLVKITVNMGMGEALQNPKILDTAVEELNTIAGQKCVVTKAKKSIATFKLRQGQKIGCMVTLRREKMWEFLDRLVNLALPRVRDFKGVAPKAFDGRGNYSLGIREQIIFPEINYDKIDKIKGLNISIVTTARTDDEGRALLRFLGMPFRA